MLSLMDKCKTSINIHLRITRGKNITVELGDELGGVGEGDRSTAVCIQEPKSIAICERKVIAIRRETEYGVAHGKGAGERFANWGTGVSTPEADGID